MFSKIFPKIHTEGYRFLIISGVATLVLYALSTFLGLLGLVITIWVYYFFRDPDRTSINDDKYLVSPADGEIIKVEEVDGPKELGLEDRKFKKISIFMKMLIFLNFLSSRPSSLGPSTSSTFIISPSAGLTRYLSSLIEVLSGSLKK